MTCNEWSNIQRFLPFSSQKAYNLWTSACKMNFFQIHKNLSIQYNRKGLSFPPSSESLAPTHYNPTTLKTLRNKLITNARWLTKLQDPQMVVMQDTRLLASETHQTLIIVTKKWKFPFKSSSPNLRPVNTLLNLHGGHHPYRLIKNQWQQYFSPTAGKTI